MKEALMTRLSSEEVMNLLGVETIHGTPGQLERLRKWIERLAAKHGNTYVLKNRRSLLDQWERHMELKTFECC